MKTEDYLLIGGLAVGGYLAYKAITGKNLGAAVGTPIGEAIGTGTAGAIIGGATGVISGAYNYGQGVGADAATWFNQQAQPVQMTLLGAMIAIFPPLGLAASTKYFGWW